MREINFLKERRLLLKKKSQKLFFLRTWSVAFLIGYGLITLVIFSWQLITKKQNENLTAKIKEEETMINTLAPLETKQVYLTSKIKSLATILASKKKHQKIVEAVLALIPEGLAVRDFKISQEGIVSFNANSLSLKTFNNFLTSLEASSDSAKLKLRKVDLTDISYGYKGKYIFGVSLSFFLGEEDGQD